MKLADEITVNDSAGQYEITSTNTMRVSDALIKYHEAIGRDIAFPCNGTGRCGNCKIIVRGNLFPPEENELSFLEKSDLSADIRLACKATFKGKIEIPFDNPIFTDKVKIEVYSENDKKALNNNQCNPSSDSQIFPLAEQISFFSSGYASVAVDIGTTTIALSFITESGDRASDGFLNPLKIYGDDVISRITAISENKTTVSEMQKMLILRIEEAITYLCRQYGVKRTDDKYNIKRMTVSANTVNEHIFCGINPTTLGVAPYKPESLFGERYSSDSLGFSEITDTEIFVFPCISGFVGGDTVSGVFATDIEQLAHYGANVLFCDIGTNGEIVFASRGTLYSCSCAAGPALEGADIECGCISKKGAIDTVSLSDNANGFSFTTIGNTVPCGICGSGLIDAVSAMLDCGLIDRSGRMVIDKIYLDRVRNIYISQADIRRLQTAKAAVGAGISLLLEKCGKSVSDIDKLILAGGFGKAINTESAKRIGLIPDVVREKIRSLGNISLRGAEICLTDEKYESKLCRLSERIKYIELSESAEFNNRFVDCMTF